MTRLLPFLDLVQQLKWLADQTVLRVLSENLFALTLCRRHRESRSAGDLPKLPGQGGVVFERFLFPRVVDEAN
jgi:hypothetical protein